MRENNQQQFDMEFFFIIFFSFLFCIDMIYHRSVFSCIRVSESSFFLFLFFSDTLFILCIRIILM